MQAKSVRVAVVIASLGRPEELGQWRERIASQTMAPHMFIYSVTAEQDLPPESERVPGAVIIVGPKGSTVQRNAGIEAAMSDSDVIAFFDDDYLPSRTAIEGLGWLFGTHPDIISANGKLLADGINSSGIAFTDAMAMLDVWDAVADRQYQMKPHEGGLYGCNMVYRTSAIGDVRFDDALPLYGWQEDVDFGAQLVGRGRTVITDAFAGVHQGTKRGRTSGEKLGYSQVANPFYLVDKGTMRLSYAVKIVAKNFLSNHLRMFRPEPWVDRSGRARGNRKALLELAMGRSHPRRALEMG